MILYTHLKHINIQYALDKYSTKSLVWLVVFVQLQTKMKLDLKLKLINFVQTCVNLKELGNLKNDEIFWLSTGLIFFKKLTHMLQQLTMSLS